MIDPPYGGTILPPVSPSERRGSRLALVGRICRWPLVLIVAIFLARGCT